MSPVSSWLPRLGAVRLSGTRARRIRCVVRLDIFDFFQLLDLSANIVQFF